MFCFPFKLYILSTSSFHTRKLAIYSYEYICIWNFTLEFQQSCSMFDDQKIYFLLCESLEINVMRHPRSHDTWKIFLVCKCLHFDFDHHDHNMRNFPHFYKIIDFHHHISKIEGKCSLLIAETKLNFECAWYSLYFEMFKFFNGHFFGNKFDEFLIEFSRFVYGWLYSIMKDICSFCGCVVANMNRVFLLLPFAL